MSFRAACIQLTSTDDMAQNIAVMQQQVAQAAKQGAELITLPENVFYMRAEASAAIPRYDENDHPGVRAACDVAKEAKIWLLVGSVAISGENATKHANRSLLITPEGNIAARYDKIHLFDVEVGDGQRYAESDYTQGGDKSVMADTPLAKLGLSICYDMRFATLYRVLAQGGAEILAMPSAFTRVTGEAHWHVLLRARAIETGCYVIAPAQCGTHPGGRQTYGHSLIIDPWGKILVDAGEEPGIIYAEIDPQKVKETRAKLPSLQHGRAFDENT